MDASERFWKILNRQQVELYYMPNKNIKTHQTNYEKWQKKHETKIEKHRIENLKDRHVQYGIMEV